MPDDSRVLPADEVAEFVMSFVDTSREDREDFEDIWDEVERNFLVRPWTDESFNANTRYPFRTKRITQHTMRGRSILKDPETHQIVMTIVSNIALSLFPHAGGFIQSRPVGGEDVFKSTLANKLLQYAHRLPGHYLAIFEWLLAMTIYGTGWLEASWMFKEEPRQFQAIDFDEFGDPQRATSTFMAPVYDDPSFEVIDIRDMFPDMSNCNRKTALGMAKRFWVTKQTADIRVEQEIYDGAAVSDAVDARSANDQSDNRDHESEDQTDLSHRKTAHPDFVRMTGFEYVGLVPFKSDDGFDRRIVTVLEGQTVRNDPWPRECPWFDVKIIPRIGSWYGIAPGEIVRHDQDFADMLKMMLADAIVKAVHPPHIYNTNAEVQVAKLRAFKPDVPVGANSVDAVKQLEYNPPVAPAFSMWSGVKQEMRTGSGALNPVQGLESGTKRLSATEFAGTRSQAFQRPEMFNVVVEREYLPPLGKFTMSLFQEFLEPGTDDLQRRVGETEFPVDLGDILLDYDIEYIGSRVESDMNQQIAASREIFQASANPLVSQLVPWIPFLKKYFERLGEYEIAAMVGNPQLVQFHLMLSQLAAPNQLGGNGNQTAPAPNPSGLLPAQLSGTVQ
jgi:hypothetical protein